MTSCFVIQININVEFLHVLYGLKTSLEVCLFILSQCVTFAAPSYHPKASYKGPSPSEFIDLGTTTRFSTYVKHFKHFGHLLSFGRSNNFKFMCAIHIKYK